MRLTDKNVGEAHTSRSGAATKARLPGRRTAHPGCLVAGFDNLAPQGGGPLVCA